MKNIEILVSYQCNNRCRYCFLPEHIRGLTVPLSEVARKLQWARGRGAEGVYFSGGEPTVYQDLPVVLRAVAGMGFSRIAIRTNGMMLSYESYLDKLVSSGANSFIISLKTHEKEKHDELSRRAGGFDQTR